MISYIGWKVKIAEKGIDEFPVGGGRVYYKLRWIFLFFYRNEPTIEHPLRFFRADEKLWKLMFNQILYKKFNDS